jgi:hypothetical protein
MIPMARTKKHAKHVPTAAELVNDPSIRWFSYKQGELIWSDTHGDHVRFWSYNADGSVQTATRNGISPEANAVSALSVRRPSVNAEWYKS